MLVDIIGRCGKGEPCNGDANSQGCPEQPTMHYIVNSASFFWRRTAAGHAPYLRPRLSLLYSSPPRLLTLRTTLAAVIDQATGRNREIVRPREQAFAKTLTSFFRHYHRSHTILRFVETASFSSPVPYNFGFDNFETIALKGRG